MIYGVTKTDDVRQLLVDGLALCDQGKYPKLIRRVEYDQDADGRVDGIKLLMTKVDTAYSTTSYASLCLIKLPAKDFYRDVDSEDYDPDYIPFCEAVGLKVLAYGENCYDQIKNDPVALLEWQSVLPDVEVLDINGLGTGVFEFQPWIEFDAPIRN